jgi:hypothetical protein
MTTIARHIVNSRFAAAAALSALLATSCAPFQSAPQQTQASNPTVSYKYHSDDELIQTNQLAATYCDRYENTNARPLSFKTDRDDERVVAYECVPTSLRARDQSSSNSNLTYTYRTDQELLDVSQDAQAYCINAGSSQVASRIVSNGNGTKTVTFQCRPS